MLRTLLNKVDSRVAMSPISRHLKLSYELLLAAKLKNERMAQMTNSHLVMSRSASSLSSKMHALAFGPDDMSSVSTASSAAMSTSKPRLRRRRWYLGIQSKKSPALVMGEIFRVLASMQLQWKVMSPYVGVRAQSNSHSFDRVNHSFIIPTRAPHVSQLSTHTHAQTQKHRYELRCRYLIKKEEGQEKDKSSKNSTPFPEKDVVFESLKNAPKDFE